MLKNIRDNLTIPTIREFKPVDVAGSLEYLWTTNVSPDARSLAPKIEIEFFQQTRGQLIEAVGRARSAFSGVLANSDDASYLGMYRGVPVLNGIFPFFSSEYISLQHQFESSTILQNLGGAIAKSLPGFVGGVANFGLKVIPAAAAVVSPGFFWENAKAWGATETTSTTFAFNLYNTIGKSEDTSKAIFRHKRLVDTLIYLNSIQKYGPALMLPPVICRYSVPGVKYSPAASMNITITNLGQVTYMNDMNIPDAYEISITLTDLLVRSRNFHSPDGPIGSIASNIGVNVFSIDSKNRDTMSKNEIKQNAIDAIASRGTN